jgi:hypothetical protein
MSFRQGFSAFLKRTHLRGQAKHKHDKNMDDKDMQALAELNKEKRQAGLPETPAPEKETKEEEVEVKEEEETPNQDEETEEEEEEEPAKENPQPKTPPKRRIPQEVYDVQRAKWKAKLDAEREARRELLDKLTERTVEKEKPLTKEETEDEIQKFADENGMDVSVVEKLLNLSKKGFEKQFAPQLEALTKAGEATKKQAEIEQFETQWKEVASSLKESYPNASAKQLEEAKKIIDQMAHTEEHKNHSLDYIAFKAKADLEPVLFSPKKKGLESKETSFQVPDEEAKGSKPLGKNPSLSEIRDREKWLQEQSEFDHSTLEIIGEDGQPTRF